MDMKIKLLIIGLIVIIVGFTGLYFVNQDSDMGKLSKSENITMYGDLGNSIYKNTTFIEILNASKETKFFDKSISLNKDILIISNQEFRGEWFPTGHPLVNFKNITISFQLENTILHTSTSVKGSGLIPRYYGGHFDINISNPNLINVPYTFKWEYSTNFKEVNKDYVEYIDILNNDTGELNQTPSKIYSVLEKEYNNYFPLDISKTTVLNDYKDGFLDPDVSVCGDFFDAGIYDLTQNVTAEGGCFGIIHNNITLDCHGYNITYATGGSGTGIAVSKNNTIVRSCKIFKFTAFSTSNGISLSNGINKIIDNNTISITGSTSYPINLGIVTNSTISNNILSSSVATDKITSTTNAVTNTTFYNNIISGPDDGIAIRGNNNRFINNTIYANLNQGSETTGITVSFSRNNVFINNSINCSVGKGIIFSCSVTSLGNCYQIIDTSNLVNGQPVFYRFNVSNTVYDRAFNNNYSEIIFAVSDNITISNNNLTNNGLFLHQIDHSNIVNNSIEVQQGWGIYTSYVNNSLFSNNFINISPLIASSYLKGFLLQYTSRNNITGNTMISDGLISLASLNYITNENIYDNFFNSDLASTTYFPSAYNINFSNNNITLTGTLTYGIGLSSTYNSYFGNNIINATGVSAVGIYLSSSKNNELENNIVYNANAGYSIFYDTETHNNTFNNQKIYYDGTVQPIYISLNYHNFSMIDTSIITLDNNFSTIRAVNVVKGTRWNITNLTINDNVPFNISRGFSNGTLYTYWYLESYVNDTSGNPIEGANVTVTDNINTLQFSELTGADGRIARKTLLEYYRNYTGTYFSTNYSINVSKEGYYSENSSINLTMNTFKQFLLSPTGGEPPTANSSMNITLILPQNNTNVSNPLNFTYNVSSFNTLLNCSLLINGSINSTVNTPTKDLTFQNFSVTLANSTYAWNITCVDSMEIQFNSTDYWIVIVNQSEPPIIPVISSINITLISPANNTNASNPLNLTYNVSSYYNLNNCSLLINGTINSTINSPTKNLAFQNFSINLRNATYNWNVSCWDSQLTVFNGTQTWILIVNQSNTDVISSVNISLISPPDNTNASNPINFTYNVSSYYNLLNCSLILNGTINSTIVSPTKGLTFQNFTKTLTNSTYKWNVTCTDNQIKTFNGTQAWALIVNESLPYAPSVPSSVNITFFFPENNTNHTSPVAFNYSVFSYYNIDNCSLNLNNSLVFNDTTINKNANNSFSISLTNATYIWNVSCIDNMTQRFNSSVQWQLIVNESLPYVPPVISSINITLISPANNTNASNPLNLTYNVSSYYNLNNCSLLINGTINSTINSPTKNLAFQNFSINLRNATYNWNVSCWDSQLTVFNGTQTWILIVNQSNTDVISSVNISLISPPDNTNASNPINFTYNVSSYYNLLNCSLILNGTINSTIVSPTKGLTFQNFTKTLTNSTYKWNVTCTDNQIKTFNGTQAWALIVNESLPYAPSVPSSVNITFFFPENNTNHTSPVAFNYSVFSYYNIDNCSLNLNNSLVFNDTTINKNANNSFSISLTNATYIWNVSCIDNMTQRFNSSVQWQLIVNESLPYVPPIISSINITLISPANNTNLSNPLNFTYNVSSHYNLVNCSLIINGSINNTDTTITEDVNQSIVITLANSTYAWNISCWDDQTIRFNGTQTWILIVNQSNTDAASNINITLHLPTNNTNHTSPVTFNYSVFSYYNLDNCSLNINNSVYNDTSITKNANNSFTISMSNATYYWNVTCWDNQYKKFNTSYSWILIVNETPYTPAQSNMNITLISPANNTNISNPVSFTYNVSSEYAVSNCSLVINGSINATDISITEDINQTLIVTLFNSTYVWNVTCWDNNNQQFNGTQGAWIIIVNESVTTPPPPPEVGSGCRKFLINNLSSGVNVFNVDCNGYVNATKYYGDGSGLTGITSSPALGSYGHSNFTDDFISIGGNATIIRTDNSSLFGGSDGTKIANNTNANLRWVNTTNINSTAFSMLGNVNSNHFIYTENINTGTSATTGVTYKNDGGRTTLYRTSAGFNPTVYRDSFIFYEEGGGDTIFIGAGITMRLENNGNVGLLNGLEEDISSRLQVQGRVNASSLIISNSIMVGINQKVNISSSGDVNATNFYGSSLSGVGNGYACLDSTGKFYRSALACV